MVMTVPAGELCDAMVGGYKHKGLLTDVTFAGSQAAVQLCRHRQLSGRHFRDKHTRALRLSRTRVL